MPTTTLKRSAAKKSKVPPAAEGGNPPPAAGTGDPAVAASHAASPPESGEHPPTRSARRAQRTRSRLETAALSTFVEVGVGATTIEMITERADLGKGTFYQHFSTKEELLVHLVDRAVDRMIARISKALSGRDEKGVRDIRATIEAIVNAHLDHFQTNREEFTLFFQGHGVVNLLGAPPENLESSYLRYLEKLEGFIRERLPASPGDVTLRRMACAIAGFAVGYLSFAVLGLSEENLRETYRPVRDTLVNGLTALIERALAVPADRAPPAASPPPADRGPAAPAPGDRPAAGPDNPPSGSTSPMITPP